MMNIEAIQNLLPMLEGFGITPSKLIEQFKPQAINWILQEEKKCLGNIFFAFGLNAEKNNFFIKIYKITDTGSTLYKEIDIENFIKEITAPAQK